MTRIPHSRTLKTTLLRRPPREVLDARNLEPEDITLKLILQALTELRGTMSRG
jgi:hypothetical protein